MRYICRSRATFCINHLHLPSFINIISEYNINPFWDYSPSLITVFSSLFGAVGISLKKIFTTHRAIQSLSPDIIFSDPHRIISLPFPSPLEIPDRFRPAKSQGDVDVFHYIGRSIFENLLEEVQNPDFLLNRYDLYLYGPSGAGKSHLLAALVCHLVKDGKRVIYIPDCRRLVLNARECLRSALLFAFHDDRNSCETIEKAESADDLVNFVRQLPDQSVYLVVDQRNALEEAEKCLGSTDYDPDMDTKVRVWEYLRLMSCSAFYIFSASANHRKDRDASRKQSSIKPLFLQAGLSEVFPHLFNHFVSYSPGGGGCLVHASQHLATEAL